MLRVICLAVVTAVLCIGCRNVSTPKSEMDFLHGGDVAEAGTEKEIMQEEEDAEPEIEKEITQEEEDETMKIAKGKMQDLVLHAKKLYLASDWKGALKVAKPLAERGSAEAQLLIGNLYGRGVLGAKDFARAIKWWDLSAKAANAKAQFNLAVAYELGDGVPVDMHQADEWLREAAAGGHDAAMIHLGKRLLCDRNNSAQLRGEGYMWLRTASALCENIPMFALGSALQESNITSNSVELQKLREDSLQFTIPYSKVARNDTIAWVDRDESMTYFINRAILKQTSRQNQVLNSATEDPRYLSEITLRAMGVDLSRQMRNTGIPFPVSIMPWVFFKKGYKSDGPEVIPVPSSILWELVRPGDIVEISDGLNSHVTCVYSVDRIAGHIEFLDAWPNTFLLLSGRNALDISARSLPLGKTRTLLSISKNDFIMAALGILTHGSPTFIDTVVSLHPSLVLDPKFHLGVGSSLVQNSNDKVSCMGVGYLWTYISESTEQTSDYEKRAAIDRLAWGVERCVKAKIEKVSQRPTLRSGPSSLSISDIRGALREKLHPTFSTLDPTTLAEISQIWTENGQYESAMKIINEALEVMAGNENLLVARARLNFQAGMLEPALADIDKAIASLEAKIVSTLPTVRGPNGVVMGAATGKEALRALALICYEFRGKISLKIGRSQEALDAANAMIRLDSSSTDARQLAVSALETIGDIQEASKIRNKLQVLQALEGVEKDSILQNYLGAGHRNVPVRKQPPRLSE